MSGRTISFGSASAGPGEKNRGILEVREGRKKASLGVAVVNGAREGEHAVAIANQHGGEINGIESLRLFYEQVNPRRMSGSVFLVFSANPRAAMLQNEFYPEDVDAGELKKFQGGKNREPGFDRHACPFNMNRRWPGAKGGYLVDRAVYEIWNRAILAPHRRASLLLDYHCHGTTSSIYCSYRQDLELALVSGSPAVIFTRSGAVGGHGRRYSRVACREAGIQSLTVELGGQNAMVPRSIEDGRRIIFNLLRFWGMLPENYEYYPDKTVCYDPWRNDVVKRSFASPSYEVGRAGKEGLLVPALEDSARVRRGQLLCHVTDPFTGRVVEEHRAGMAGALLNIGRGGAVCRSNDALYTVSMARWVDPREQLKKVRPEMFRGPRARWTV